MHHLLHLSAALLFASSASCLPHDQNQGAPSIGGVGKGTCIPNTFEKNSLAHYDINTGEVILDGSVTQVGKLLDGTSCSSLLAGGSHDNGLTNPNEGYSNFERRFTDMKGKVALKMKRHGPDGDEEMPSTSTPPAPKTPTSSPKSPPKIPTTPIPKPPTPKGSLPKGSLPKGAPPKGPAAGEAAEWADTILGVLGLGKGKPS